MKEKNLLALKLTASALIILAVFSSSILLQQGSTYAFLLLAAALIISACFIVEISLAQKNAHKFIAELDNNISQAEKDVLYYFPSSIVILDKLGKIVWYNKIFTDLIKIEKDTFGINLTEIFDIDLEVLKENNHAMVMNGDTWYQVLVTNTIETNKDLMILCFEDVTEHVNLKDLHERTHPSVVLLTVDNYEDLLQNAKESEKANVIVKLEKLLETFMESTNGLIRRVSNDKYIAVLEEQHLKKMIDGKFPILDKARKIEVNERMHVTLSIGVGHGASTLAESETFAKQSLDMALGRGGDQVALKTTTGFQFFGGVSKGIEKQSRIKSRIIATALLELIHNSDTIYVMGHKFGDLDSIGGSVGLVGAIRKIGKTAYSVVDSERNLSKPLINKIKETSGEDLFMSPQTAISKINDRSLLIVVDTHNKNFIESYDLYNIAKHIVVIDHHRKTVDHIDNAVIFYHEPYASSACEMISEIIQYFGEVGKLPIQYAEALLAGIMLDTKNFVMKTGVRTFEAAAYLKKMGADTVAVKTLFSNSIEHYQQKTRLVSSAQIYNNCAIATSEIEHEEVRVIAPQAADELLGISGVVASFVIFSVNGIINISARSMGNMNVQVIMEKLGGGGHQTMAGTQMENHTIESASQLLLEAIDEFTNVTVEE